MAQGDQSRRSGVVARRDRLEGNTRRAIDVPEGEEIDEQAFVALIRAAVSLNAG